ncbi:hypothetical protein [Actinoplanes sp. NPDC049599]|uniref:hypothetical protein n=1 Tax=Actinoplanes sp. NPDC049599 TaxID=3363903 RepID=UPI0037B603E4
MRAALIVMGTVLMGYAVLGAVTDPDLRPGGVVLFLAVALVAHDAVLLPMTIAAGAILARYAPRWALPSMRAAAIVSLTLGVIALPLVLGVGRTADNPSILPLAYGRGLLLILALSWSVALASVALARHRARRPRPADAPPDSDRPSRPGGELHG